jgi:hypothetical protein
MRKIGQRLRQYLLPTASGLPAADFRWRWQFEFKLQDLWIGAFWKRIGNCMDLWICFLPCIPLHLSWWWHDPEQ